MVEQWRSNCTDGWQWQCPNAREGLLAVQQDCPHCWLNVVMVEQQHSNCTDGWQLQCPNERRLQNDLYHSDWQFFQEVTSLAAEVGGPYVLLEYQDEL